MEPNESLDTSRRRFLTMGNDRTACDEGQDQKETKACTPTVIDDPEVAEAAETIMKDPKMMAAAALILGIGLTSSQSAEAGVEDRIGDAVGSAIEPAMQAMTSEILQVFMQFWSLATDASSMATAMGSQAIQDMMKRTHDAQVLQDARPAPQSCVSDGASRTADYGRKRAAGLTSKQGAFVAREYMQGGSGAQRKAAAEMQARERDFPNDEDINAAPLIEEEGYSEEQLKAAQALLRRLRGEMAIDNITLTDAQINSAKGAAHQIKKTAVAARENMAMTPLHAMIARRTKDQKMGRALKAAVDAEKDLSDWDQARVNALLAGGQGVSYMEVMQYEVDRRYANPDWKSLMEDAPSSVPPLREIANMLAQQNHMLLEMFKLEESALAVESSEAIRGVSQDARDLLANYGGN